MKKVIVPFLVAILLIAGIFTSFSTPVLAQDFNITLVSSTTTETAGYTSTNPESEPLNPAKYSGGGNWVAAQIVSSIPWGWYTGGGAAPARWVSTSSTDGDPSKIYDRDAWRLYRTTFNIPSGATITSAIINATADNAFAIYVNGQLIVEEKNHNDVYHGGRSDGILQNLFTISLTNISQGNNTLFFVVRNWDNYGNGNPTGLLYRAVIRYSINQPPVNTVPPAQSINQDTNLIFSSATGNIISVSDVDAGSNQIQITLNATNGALTLGSLSGLTFSQGDGVSDTLMTFVGTIQNINAALDGLRFAPTPDYCGAASVQVTSNDLGYTGGGGAKTDTKIVSITVRDTRPPVIVAPPDITVNTDAGKAYASGVALGTPNVTDNSGNANATNNAPSQYPRGVTTVTWTATDSSGNSASASQKVTVYDKEPPRITPPADVTVNTDAGKDYATGVVLGTPTVTDNAPGVTFANNGPAQYPLGATAVTWTATDSSGNSASASQKVTVCDKEPPRITITSPAPGSQITAGSTIAVEYVVNDNCDPSPSIIVTPSSTIPPPLAVGSMTITVKATDASGNQALASVTVNIIPETTSVNIDPNTLKLKSGGNWITAYIKAPNGCDVHNIDGATARLNGTVPGYLGKEGWAKAEANDSNLADFDGDGILERMVKFDRSLVESMLITGDRVPITVSGKVAGVAFEGIAYIKVIKETPKK